ncbi:MAG: hypothetical protein AB7F96_22195 [Beijerinckiaceae bacterium]
MHLEAQADAAKVCWQEKRDFASTIKGLVETRRRPETELARATERAADMHHIARTLALLVKNKAALPPELLEAIEREEA